MRKATSIALPGCSLLCRRLMVCAGLQLSGFRARRLGFVRSPKSGRSHTLRVIPEAAISNHRVAWHPDSQPRRIPPHLAPRAWRRWANPGPGGCFSPFPLLPPVSSPQHSIPPARFPATFSAVFLCMGWRPVAPPRIRKRTRCILQEQTEQAEKEPLFPQFPPVQPEPP